MCGKIIIFTVCFLALTTLQLAQATNSVPLTPRPGNQNVSKCYTCDSITACKKPKIVTCDQKSVNATLNGLAVHFSELHNETSSNFECLRVNYHLKNHTINDVRGCIYAGVNTCPMHPKNSSSMSNVTCKICHKDLCNPAACVSSNLSAIMLTTIFGLMLVKFGYF